MNTVLILAAMFGQYRCDASGCYVMAPRLLAVMPTPSAQTPRVIQEYRVSEDGLEFAVKGYMEGGLIYFDRNDAFNRASRTAAERGRVSPRITPPVAAPKSAGEIDNYGLAPERMMRQPVYRAHSAEARQFVREAQAEAEPNARLHVTVIGTDAERAGVMKDLVTNPALVGLKDEILVQDYAPEEWPVESALGFQPGKPSIVIQTAKGPSDPKGGKVVYRASDYSMGPEALAAEIRKADPNYKPQSDPGPSTGISGSKCPLGFSRDHWPWIAAVVIGLFLLPATRKEG